MYSSADSDSTDPPEEDEEGKLYQFISEMNTTTNVQEEKEEIEIPPSPENTLVHVKIDPERTPQAVGEWLLRYTFMDGSEDKTTQNTQSFTVSNKKGIDMDVLDNTEEIPIVKANAKEKPWRKAGAKISDYFNYGFDEESWKTYRKKQAKVRSANRKQYTKTMGQKGCTRHEEKENSPACSSPGSPSMLASRQLGAATDVTGGQPECSSRVEGRQCLRHERNNSQVATEMSPEEDRFTSYHLSSPSNLSFPFAYVPPPPFLYRSGPPRPSSLATLDRDSKGVDGPSTLRPGHSSGTSGVPSFIPRCMASNAGVINTAKAWECYLWEEKCEKNRERSGQRGRDEDSHRGRGRDRQSCFPSHSKEERVRHRDTAEPGHKRTFDRYSGEKGGNREKRHRADKDRWQEPSSSRSSSSRRRDTGEDRDGRSKSKNKKKRNRKGKKSHEMFFADQERKLKYD